MSLLPPTDQAICRSMEFLTSFKTDMEGEGPSWPEKKYTGTGIPRFFYLVTHSIAIVLP